MIGIFDSGFGGLTIFQQIKRVLPEYDYLYVGDNARAPYGGRSQETIYRFTVEAVDWLFQQGYQLIILACNSASAEALRKIQQEWLPQHYPDRRVLGVIRPVVEEAVNISKTGRIGVVGTRATITSRAYEREIKKLRPDAAVIQKACPLLVPFIEEGWMNKPETKRILRTYIRPLKMERLDTLILGCTHYPILYDEFALKIGRRVRVLDPGPIVADKLKEYLVRHPEVDQRLTRGGKARFVTTDDPKRFCEFGSTFGEKITAEKIEFSS